MIRFMYFYGPVKIAGFIIPKIQKICRQNMSIMFNEICINKEMLPKYTYIYICVCVRLFLRVYCLYFIKCRLKFFNEFFFLIWSDK